MSDFDFIHSAQRTIRLEGAAVAALEARISDNFSAACKLILSGTGRVIVTGMGKSGHIGKKIAATLASTGTPSFFVHPGEANHGDLGMITKDDIVLAISYSGSSSEILSLLPLLKRAGIKIISMTGNPQSILAEAAEVHLNIAVETEACPLDLAPTSSTTATLVMGDALAIALLEARGLPLKTLPSLIPAAPWDANFCCVSRTSCTPAMKSRKSARIHLCWMPLW
jgi:arabinose-5-phosphate isomerase